MVKKPTKSQVYHNVALKSDTYVRLAKIGEKGDSFDQIISKILKERKRSLSQDIGIRSPGPEISSI